MHKLLNKYIVERVWRTAQDAFIIISAIETLGSDWLLFLPLQVLVNNPVSHRYWRNIGDFTQILQPFDLISSIAIYDARYERPVICTRDIGLRRSVLSGSLLKDI